MIAALAARFLALPQWARNTLYGIGIAILAGVLFLGWLWQHDRKVLQREQAKREAAASKALDQSAEERANDAVRGIIAEKDRETAIAEAEKKEAQKAPLERATLPPTTVALNCQRLRQAYSAEKLAKMPGYAEKCK